MKPMTRTELFMATAAGEYSGELPEPVTRLEYYLKKIKEAVENGSPVAPEDIDTAIEAYLNSHDADIVTEQELSDALAGYYDKSAVDTALAGKADTTATQTALNAKQNALTAGAGISISNGEISNTAPNVKPDWNAASGSDAEILNKPTIPSYSNATASAAGLMSAADKEKLDGQGVVLWESSGGVVRSAADGSNTIQLSESLSGYRFVEVDVSNGTVHTCARAEVTNGETPRFSFLLPTGTGTELVTRVQNIGISTSNNVSTLTIYSSISYTFLYSSGSLRMTTNDNWQSTYHKIVGYK